MAALKQQEANWGRSVHAVLEWGCSLWFASRISIAALNEQNGHEKVDLVMRMSAVLGALVIQQAKMVYRSCSAEMQIMV